MRKIIYICDRCNKDMVREVPPGNIEEKLLVLIGEMEVCADCFQTIKYLIKK